MSCSSQPPFNAYNLEYTNLIIFKKQSTNKMMITQKRLRAVDPGSSAQPSGTAQINAQINRESTIHAWFNQWWKRPRDTQLERDYRRMNSWFSTLFLFLFLLFLNAFRSSLLFLSTAMIENLM